MQYFDTEEIELHIDIEYTLVHTKTYPARALRAQGLLLADSVPSLGWGKTFWRLGRVPLTKTSVTRKRNEQFE